MLDGLKKRNIALNRALKNKGISVSGIKVSVVSTRKYPFGTYRWTAATYKGVPIESYALDPRQPNLSKEELSQQKVFELVTAKKALFDDMREYSKIMNVEGETVLRLVCSCCGSHYEDYQVSDLNGDDEFADIEFLCTMCEENVTRDARDGEIPRNTPDELELMCEHITAFRKKYEAIDSGNL